MKLSKYFFRYSLLTIFNLVVFISDIFAQPKLVVPERARYEGAEDNTWWYVMMFLLVAGLGSAIYWYLNDKKSKKAESDLAAKKKKQFSANDNAVDFDSELEWYRKHKNVVNKKPIRNPGKNIDKVLDTARINGNKDKLSSEKNFDKKLENLQFSQLPIARFERLAMARPFMHLPISNDDALLSAIEQTQDEFEEDESVRELAVRILARFETKNSVESLSQVALYDLSSILRSKAVGILSDFDHESVFEILLLACADPTREVKAAAARGLFRLNFDRSDCWMRIAECGDEFRMRHAARAAVAGELVERSFIRLVGNDEKAAYEVMTLIVLLIKSGETKEVFDALENHPNQNIRKAILHIIKITKEPNALEGLYHLLESKNLSGDLREEIGKLVEEFGLVAA